MTKAKIETRVNGHKVEFGPGGLPQLETFLTAGSKVIEAWRAIGTELIEFGKARVDQSIEMSSAVARSSSFNEVVELQTKFAQSTMNDLLAEARKLADIGTRPIIESFAAVQKTAQRETARTTR